MKNNKNEMKDELLIQSFVESLKKLKAPKGLRQSNRKYIKDALHSEANNTTKAPNWLKKRISVPLPVAAGFLLIICLQIILQFTNVTNYFKASETMIPDKTQKSSIGLSRKRTEPYYSEHGVYVAGMGFIEQTKSYDYFKENDYETNL